MKGLNRACVAVFMGRWG